MRRSLKYFNLVVLILIIINYIFSDTIPIRGKDYKNISDIEFGVTSISFNSASFYWRYPEGITFDMGDYLNLILIDNEVGDHGQIPVFSKAHNMNDVNLKSITNFESESLSPSTSYTAKLEIVRSNGDSYVYEHTFSTEEFEVSNLKFQNLQDNITNKKNVRLAWNVTSSSIKFGDNDKMVILMKKFTDNDFSKIPIFESNEMVTRADIELPNFEELYQFKIIYTIGGRNIESEIFEVDAVASGLNFKIKDITTNSARLNWEFTDDEILNDNSEIQIFVKEDRFVDYDVNPFLKITGRDDLLSTKEFLLQNLKFGTKYNLKIKFIIETIEEFEERVPIFKEDEYEFETHDFSLDNLKIERSENNKCILRWEYKGSNISFSTDDTLNVYVKESDYDKYLQPISTISENLINTKNVEIVLPKYNTSYDIKVEVSMGERRLFEYLTYEIEVPKVIFKIGDINEKSLKFVPVFDNISFQNGDRIQIFLKKSEDSVYPTVPNKEFEQSSSQNILDLKEISLSESDFTSSQDTGQKYDFKVDIIKDGMLFQEEIYNVEMQNKLQIVKVSFQNKSEKQVEATIEYAPFDFNFENVESLSVYKYLSNGTTNSKQDPYIQIKQDFENNNKVTITFDEFNDYKLKFVYKVKDIQKPEDSDSSDNTDDNSESGVEEGGGGETTYSNINDNVEREVSYRHEFNIFSFQLQDVVLSDIKLKFQFKKYYSFSNGDKLEIFIKKYEENNFSDDPIVKYEHGKDNVDLGNAEVINITGLEHGTRYIFNAKFIPLNYKDNILEKQVEVITNDIDFSDINIYHVSDLTAVVRWKLGKDFEFSPNDVLNIFYKKDSENEYPKRPNETVNDVYLEDGVFIYLDNIDTKYDIKLVFQVGSKSFEKEFRLNTEIDTINSEIYEIYQTSAYLKWDYPDNYVITNGENISIFVKESNDQYYGDEPDYFLEHNEENQDFLQDFRSAKLFDLMPNTNYDVKILLDFGEVGKKEREISFKTEELIMSDISITDIKPFEFNIAWDVNYSTVDFNEEYDSLDIYIKTSEQSWNEDSLVYRFSKGLNNFNKVRFVIDAPELVYDVKIEYNLVGDKVSKMMSTKLFTLSYKEIEYGSIDVLFRYPSPVNFEEGDEIIVFVKKPKSTTYEQKFLYKHSLVNNLNSLTSTSLNDIQQTSHIASYINSKKVNIFPSQVIYDTRAENSSTLEIVSELKGSTIDLDLPVDYELDTNSEIRNSIGGRSYYEKLNNGSYLIVIDGIVPGKTYYETTLIATDVYGNEVQLFINEFTLEPSTLLEEFLRNSYFFAFDREPDEGGYTYWKDELMKKEDVTGKYFLVNLMFSEKEFSDRNLSDEELIKVLYQIVVNREYDSKGLSYWVAIYKQYLSKFNNDQYEAKKTIVTRMIHEPEFQNLCERMGVKW